MAQTKRYYDSSIDGAFNTGGAWSAEEDAAVLAQSGSDKELAAKIGRTIRAIQHRRYKLKEDQRVPYLGDDEL